MPITVPDQAILDFRQAAFDLVCAVSQAPASLDPDFERVQDMHRSVYGGLMMAAQLLLGKDGYEILKMTLDSALKEKFGAPPDMSPSVLGTAAETGILKQWLYADRSAWNRPPNDANDAPG
jgi:hypothetical protein